MKQTIQSFFENETFVAILLILLTTGITYGVSIPGLGYYHDDWFVLWSGQARGAQSLIQLFSTDRPFMGVVYSFLYRFLGDTIINWHLYSWRTGVFLDPALDLAEAKIHDNPDGSAFYRLSGFSITTKCQHKTESSIWVWHCSALHRLDASRDENE
jgi:hypothetical protein